MHINEGFVKLPRNIASWRWYTDANALRLYIHLMIKANFADADWKNETIKKGQVVTGRKKLAEELEMNESMVTRTLKKLESTGDISLKTNNRYTIVTIEKWAEYQEKDYFFCQQTNNNRTTSEQQTNNNRTHLNNINNKKNENNKKNYSARARERKKREENSSIDWSLVDQIINA